MMFSTLKNRHNMHFELPNQVSFLFHCCSLLGQEEDGSLNHLEGMRGGLVSLQSFLLYLPLSLYLWISKLLQSLSTAKSTN